MDPIYGIVLQEQGKRENPEFLCARHLRETALPGEHPEMKWGHPGCTLTPPCVGPQGELPSFEQRARASLRISVCTTADPMAQRGCRFGTGLTLATPVVHFYDIDLRLARILLISITMMITAITIMITPTI